MGWSIGYDDNWKRDIGYGVPARCDHPDCNEEIDRGLAFACGGEPFGGEHGCGLFFCGDHLAGRHDQCERCRKGEPPFDPTTDHPDWMRWKLTDASWKAWRDQNADEVAKLCAALGEAR